MLSIGNKKYRNLQEQVGYNTECIKKLDEYLDGITIEDKLVVIESDSGTFTDEELVILSAPLAFIADGSKVWMKQSETLTELVYKAIDIVATEVSSTYFNIGGSKIVVNRETGAYNTSSDTIIEVYSKSQMDSIISTNMALKANVSGQVFTGEISAPTIKQLTSNFELNISRWYSAHGGTIEAVYTKMFVENNLDMHIVICLKITNDTGASITLSSRIAFTQANYIAGPFTNSGYADKIYDLAGNKLSVELPASTTRVVRVAKAEIIKDISSPRPAVLTGECCLYHASTSSPNSNHFGFDVYTSSSTTLNDGESAYIMSEMNLTL